MEHLPLPGLLYPYRNFTVRTLSRLWSAYQSRKLKREKRSVIHEAYGAFLKDSGLLGQYPLDEVLENNIAHQLEFNSINSDILFGIFINSTKQLKRLLGGIRAEGLERLEPYRSKGAIAVSYHIGPFSLLPLILAVQGINVTILARSDEVSSQAFLSFSTINKFLFNFSRVNEIGTMRFIDALSSLSLITIKKAVNKGEVIMIYPDSVKEASADSKPVSFFSGSIAGHSGIVKLFRLTGADLLPLKTSWDHEGRIVFSVGAPRTTGPGMPDEEIMGLIYGDFESQVRKAPDQWMRVESYKEMKY